MKAPSIIAIINAMKMKGYRVFDNPNGHDLNIVGIRSRVRRANKFDDFIIVFYRLDEQWCYMAFPATTDPGVYWLEHPLSKLGTAILKPGQYRSAYKIFKHRGKYDALIQRKPVVVLRDPNCDTYLDVDRATEETGLFGINIHCAAWEGKSIQVDKWSAGCQVVQDWYDFQILMALAQAGAKKYGNSFTYTLLNEEDL